MKKFTFLLVALFVAMTAFAATETVYFVNANNWTGTINAYAWTSASNAAWPGVAITKETDQLAGYDVYSYSAEAGTYANVIFNNGTTQTADLKWTAGKYYVKDGWYTAEEAVIKLNGPVEYETVYFVDAFGWGSANIYTWSPEVKSWPGLAMTKEAEQIEGKDVYSYTVEKGSSFGGMLFNCNGDDSKKTSDLTWTAGKYYVIDGWYTKEEVTNKLGGPTTWTIAGNFPCLGAEWATDKTENDLVEGENGIWTKTYTNVELAAGTYEYKIAKNHGWDEAYPGENAKLEIAEAGKYNLTFSFNPAKPEPICTATKVANGDNPGGNDNPNNPDQPKDTKYYVAGTKNLCNSEWNEKDPNNELQLVDNIYTKTYSNLAAGDFQFKITNGTWDYTKGFDNVDASTSTPGYTNNENGNVCFTLTSSTSITISFNAETEKITLKADGIDKFEDVPNTEVEITSYTICGDFPCFNGDWSPTNTANDMLKGENGIWTKKYENVTLEAKTYQYKVAANNNWGNNGEFPTNEANQEYIINEAGIYNLTFSYNPTTPELKCEATKTGDNPGENPGGNDNPTYTLTDGTKLYLNPSEDWKTDGARFAAYFFGGDGELWISMSDSNGDGIYEVTCQGTREKVIFCRMNPANQENNWDNKWNQTADLTYDGTNNQYNVHGWDSGEWSQFNGNGNGGNGNNGGTDDPEKPQPEADVYTLCGDSIIFGTSWNETDTLNDMTRGEDGIWVKEYSEVTLTKGTYEYKVVASHNWETPGKYPSDDTNMTLYIAKDGIYDLKFTFNPTIPELKAVATIKVNIENITINNIYAINGYVHADTDITIYTITGQDVTSQNGNLSQGIYIIKTQNATSKLIIK